MVLDIEGFFPSISENLFLKAIQFVEQITEITDEDINLIIKERETLLFNEDIPWAQKKGKRGF